MTWTRACRLLAARIVSVALVLAVLAQSVPVALAAPHHPGPVAAEMHHAGHAMLHGKPGKPALPAKEIAGCTGVICCTGGMLVPAPVPGPQSWILFAYWVPEPVSHVPGPPGGPERPPRAAA
ncbi:hypothetical protein [Poseidonocella sp. HB161398]|uniref:hypothetical protein n=1 Tax=Poseidonocella sp. HB161398 TaxID=2320855 RepID=UPI001108123E|nr:hypothetical protein [Poseidonocella sp. HB161398]